MRGLLSQPSLASIRAVINTMLDAVLPPCCVLCGEAQRAPGFCDRCQFAVLHSWPPQAVSCQCCGLPRPREPVVPEGEPCGQCKLSQLRFDRVIALGIYQDAVREAVVAAKLPRYLPLARVLGEQLAELVAGNLTTQPPDQITYVPSHFTRRLKRQGMGGVPTMALAIGERLGCRVNGLLRVTRPIRKQSMLADADRPGNVRGAFAMKKSYALRASPVLRDQHILLVDDVLTTGSTASEIASVLKNAGAARVTLAVVARAVRRG
ncbi:MAG: phosphoribosyltransferase family protein [Planctomycetaceae bacterium]